MATPRQSASAARSVSRVAARLREANTLAVCALLAAIVMADASTLARIADLPIGRGDGGTGRGGVAVAFNGNGNSGNFNGNGNRGNFNGNGNSGSFNGNGNGGSFNGNGNCGNGFGNGNSSNGNGNGKGAGGTPAWCRFLKDLNGRLGLPPGTIPDFD